MWQAEYVQDRLLAVRPEAAIEIVEIESEGDVDLTTPLVRIGSVGIFTQSLEKALLEDRIDAAVHSLKDVPAQLAPGLVLAAYSPREDARDAWFERQGRKFAELPHGATVATGSMRRRSQLLWQRPDLRLVDLRGNLDTRWRKFQAGDFDAMILAAAGVRRLGWSERVTEFLRPADFLPAVGQGIVGVEVRAGSPAEALVRMIDDAAGSRVAQAERALLAAVAGGCVVPLAGYCEFDGEVLRLRARLGDAEGKQMLEVDRFGVEPEELGRAVAADLLAAGGAELVRLAKERMGDVS
jgi:hydroxymethylbilane synthase